MNEDDDDANALLRRVHDAIAEWRGAGYATSEESQAGGDLVAAFDALNDHLKAGGALPVDWDVSPAQPDWAERARELAGQGRKIQAIKEVRAATGMSLHEAKNYVDAL